MAPQMARHLVELAWTPDIVLSSSAKRAISTAAIICQEMFGGTTEPETVEDFYLASPSVYVEWLSRLEDRYSSPMVVGHNPGLEQLVSELTATDEVMPTAAVAKVVCQIKCWSDLDSQTGKCVLETVLRPKEIHH